MINAQPKDSVMFSALYSQAVLKGLLKHGMSVGEVAKITQLPLASVKKLLEGGAGLTDKHLAGIERVTGMSGGQLALLSVNKPDESIVALMDAWAETRSWKKQPAKRIKKSAVSR